MDESYLRDHLIIATGLPAHRLRDPYLFEIHRQKVSLLLDQFESKLQPALMRLRVI